MLGCGFVLGVPPMVPLVVVLVRAGTHRAHSGTAGGAVGSPDLSPEAAEWVTPDDAAVHRASGFVVVGRGLGVFGLVLDNWTRSGKLNAGVVASSPGRWGGSLSKVARVYCAGWVEGFRRACVYTCAGIVGLVAPPRKPFHESTQRTLTTELGTCRLERKGLWSVNTLKCAGSGLVA